MKNNDKNALENEIEKGIDQSKDLLLFGSDEEVVEFFSKLGYEKEEILEGRREFLEMAKKQLFANDLKELLEEYDFLAIDDIHQMPNFDKFSTLRGNGLSLKDAFEGANGRFVAEEALKKQNLGDYSHMKKLSVKENSTGLKPIPKEEIDIWKSAFPKDTLSQLTKKYNKVKK